MFLYRVLGLIPPAWRAIRVAFSVGDLSRAVSICLGVSRSVSKPSASVSGGSFFVSACSDLSRPIPYK